MVVVVGVDVVVILLVSHVLLIAQLAVETGVPFLLHRKRERERWMDQQGEEEKEIEVSVSLLVLSVFVVILRIAVRLTRCTALRLHPEFFKEAEMF